jgi:hypothetical protein
MKVLLNKYDSCIGPLLADYVKRELYLLEPQFDHKMICAITGLESSNRIIINNNCRFTNILVSKTVTII